VSAKKTTSRRRGLLVDADRVIEERRQYVKGWGETLTLVEIAAKIGMSVKTLKKAEKGGPCDRRTIEKIAKRYGIPFDDIILPDIQTEEDAEFWLLKASCYDTSMDYGRAIKIAEVILCEMGEESPARAKTCVALASFQDHIGNWLSGIQILQDGFFSRGKASVPAAIREEWRWALYTKAFLLRRYAESLMARTGWRELSPARKLLTQAKKDLKAVQGLSGKDDVAGAKHHLGVIAMLEGRHEKARDYFLRSIAIREERLEEERIVWEKKRNTVEPIPSIRLAYSYRRLALCYLFISRKDVEDENDEADFSSIDSRRVPKKPKDAARDRFKDAWRIASLLGHKRLLAELQADLDAWGISMSARRR
jgi:tetratricopeptide (TPR) repeat protein